MKKILMGIVVAGVVVLPFALKAADLLFSDDFSKYAKGSDGSPVWTVEGGEAAVTAEGFEVKNSGTDGWNLVGVSAGKEDWTDYTLSCKVKLTSPGSDWRDGVWIAVRYMDEMNLYTISFYSGGIFLHKMSDGIGTNDETPLMIAKGENLDLRDAKWHDLKITVVKNKITVNLDGKDVLKAEDKDWNESPYIPKGKIALGARKWTNSTADCVAVFKNVMVEKAVAK